MPINKYVGLLRNQNIVLCILKSSNEMRRGLEIRTVSPLKYPITLEYTFVEYDLKQKYVA